MISLTRNLAGGDTLDSGMVHFLYSEGFLTGGFKTEINSNLPGIGQYLSYQPEQVSNYGVGVKGALVDGRVRIMVDVSWMDYSDKQESIDPTYFSLTETVLCDDERYEIRRGEFARTEERARELAPVYVTQYEGYLEDRIERLQ